MNSRDIYTGTPDTHCEECGCTIRKGKRFCSTTCGKLSDMRVQRDALVTVCGGVLQVLNHGTPNPHTPHIDAIRAAIAKAKAERGD